MSADRSYVDHNQPCLVKDARRSNEPRPGLCPVLEPGTVLFEPEDVIAAVAGAFGFTVGKLKSGERTRHVCEARDACYWLLRRHTRLPLAHISAVLVRGNHTTAIRGLQRCEERRAIDPWFRETTDRLERELEEKGGDNGSRIG